MSLSAIWFPPQFHYKSKEIQILLYPLRHVGAKLEDEGVGEHFCFLVLVLFVVVVVEVVLIPA